MNPSSTNSTTQSASNSAHNLYGSSATASPVIAPASQPHSHNTSMSSLKDSSRLPQVQSENSESENENTWSSTYNSNFIITSSRASLSLQREKIYPMDATQYELKEEIGFGTSATVYRAICKPLGEEVAIKIIDLEKYDDRILEDLSKEISIMKSCNHENVVKYYTSFTFQTSLYIVTELLEGGSVYDIMRYKYPLGLEEDVIATIMRQVLSGLDYFHEHGHIHRDIKASNILVDTDGSVRIGDFGFSARLGDNGDRKRNRSTLIGHPCWMAPEVMEQLRGYDSKADIWSFGITLIEMAEGRAPYFDLSAMQVMLKVLNCPPPNLENSKKKLSKRFKEVVDMCLKRDPTKRPTAGQLLKHKFFQKAKHPDYIRMKIMQDMIPLSERNIILKMQKEQEMKLREQEMVEASHYAEQHFSAAQQITPKKPSHGWNWGDATENAPVAQQDANGGNLSVTSATEVKSGTATPNRVVSPRGMSNASLIASDGSTNTVEDTTNSDILKQNILIENSQSIASVVAATSPSQDAKKTQQTAVPPTQQALPATTTSSTTSVTSTATVSTSNPSSHPSVNTGTTSNTTAPPVSANVSSTTSSQSSSLHTSSNSTTLKPTPAKEATAASTIKKVETKGRFVVQEYDDQKQTQAKPQTAPIISSTLAAPKEEKKGRFVVGEVNSDTDPCVMSSPSNTPVDSPNEMPENEVDVKQKKKRKSTRKFEIKEVDASQIPVQQQQQQALQNHGSGSTLAPASSGILSDSAVNPKKKVSGNSVDKLLKQIMDQNSQQLKLLNSLFSVTGKDPVLKANTDNQDCILLVQQLEQRVKQLIDENLDLRRENEKLSGEVVKYKRKLLEQNNESTQNTSSK